MTEKCDHCHEPIGVTVVWDHGKKFHPDCYAKACEEKMKEMIKKNLKQDWSRGLYEP